MHFPSFHLVNITSTLGGSAGGTASVHPLAAGNLAAGARPESAGTWWPRAKMVRKGWGLKAFV